MDIVANKKPIIVGLVIYIVLLFLLNYMISFSIQISYVGLILVGLIPGIVASLMLKSSNYSEGLVIGVISVFFGNLVIVIPQLIVYLIPGAYPANFENFITILDNSFSPVIAFEILAAIGGLFAVFINRKNSSASPSLKKSM